MPHARTLRLALASASLILAAILVALWLPVLAPHSAAGRWVATQLGMQPRIALLGPPDLATPAIGGPFRLTDPAGHTVTEASFPGQWRILYFGYTSCPDICPTTLQTIMQALFLAGPAGKRIQPLFITVDPERDTPSVLARYTALFGPRLIGLTGTPAELAAAEAAFKVYAAKVPSAAGYSMNHTGFTYLLDPAGQLQALFGAQTDAADMARRMRALVH